MDSFDKGGLIMTALLVVLLTSWAMIAAAPRHACVFPVEYDQFESDLDK